MKDAAHDPRKLDAASKRLVVALETGDTGGVETFGNQFIAAFEKRECGYQAMLGFLTCHVAELTARVAKLERGFE